jgi:predicted phosphodiesterase
VDITINNTVGCKTLVVGDAHVDETQDLRRFVALGNYILEQRPDNIVLIGDFLSFNCFSQWDRDKRKKMEGLRRNAEIDSGNAALDFMLRPTANYNKKRKKSKKNQYHPVLAYVEGNHEDREKRYLDYEPSLVGTIDYRKDLKLDERGFLFVPYRQYGYILGTGFTHVPMNKINKPIGGQRVLSTALQLHAHSVVFGHTHELKFDGEHRHGAAHYNQVLNVGCFFEHIDDYALGSKTDYWRGIITLDHYSYNRFDFSTTAMTNLLLKYT